MRGGHAVVEAHVGGMPGARARRPGQASVGNSKPEVGNSSGLIAGTWATASVRHDPIYFNHLCPPCKPAGHPDPPILLNALRRSRPLSPTRFWSSSRMDPTLEPHQRVLQRSPLSRFTGCRRRQVRNILKQRRKFAEGRARKTKGPTRLVGPRCGSPFGALPRSGLGGPTKSRPRPARVRGRRGRFVFTSSAAVRDDRSGAASGAWMGPPSSRLGSAVRLLGPVLNHHSKYM